MEIEVTATMFDFDVVPAWEVVLRIALAWLLGMAIGLDRALKNKPVDLRVYMIVATTACAMAVLSQELFADFQTSDETVNLDFTRIISGVLTGIGFLGAGAIIRNRDENEVIGSATGASIWASGGLGLALGYGFYGLTLITFVPIIATLVVLGFFLDDEQ